MTPIPTIDSDAAAAASPGWKRILVLLVGLLFVLSSGAHGLLGWKLVHQALLDARTPVDVIDTVRLGWHFGSVAMAAFGVIVLLAWNVMRGGGRPLLPATVVSITYILFGAAATIASGFSLHFVFLFVLPGIILFVGLSSRR